MRQQYKVLLIVSLIFMLKFFSYQGLDNSVSNPFQMIGAMVFVYYAFVNRRSRLARKGQFYMPIVMFLVSVFISDIPCFFFHDQSILNTLVGQRAFYCYFLYFFLYHIDADQKFMLSAFKFLFFCALAVNTIDVIFIHNPPFEWRVDDRRDSVSIFYYGRGFTILGCFYCLSEFLKTKKILYLVLYLLCAAYCFMVVSRMLTAGIAVGSGWIFLRFSKKSIANFAIIIVVLIVIGVIGVFYADKIVGSMLDVSQKQISNSQDDVRVNAYRFFFTKYQVNSFTMLFGNGVPYDSDYETWSDTVRTVNAARIGDVGLVGVWVYFGVFAVLSWIIIFSKMFFKKCNDNQLFIRAYFVTVLAEAFTGFATHNPEIMPTTIFALFWFERLGPQPMFAKVVKKLKRRPAEWRVQNTDEKLLQEN
jgi:hypothetical protein